VRRGKGKEKRGVDARRIRSGRRRKSRRRVREGGELK